MRFKIEYLDERREVSLEELSLVDGEDVQELNCFLDGKEDEGKALGNWEHSWDRSHLPEGLLSLSHRGKGAWGGERGCNEDIEDRWSKDSLQGKVPQVGKA